MKKNIFIFLIPTIILSIVSCKSVPDGFRAIKPEVLRDKIAR